MPRATSVRPLLPALCALLLGCSPPTPEVPLAAPPTEDAARSTETAPPAVAPQPHTGPPDYRVQTWQLEPWRWVDVVVSPQEYVGACRPWVTGLPLPCRTTYTHAETTLTSFCTVSDGRLSHAFQTYGEGDGVVDVEERSFQVERDPQGRVVTEELASQDPYVGTRATRCRFAYDGDATAPSWQACDNDRQGAHYVYDAAGRLSERYEAEKYTASLSELQAWVPPSGPGYWAFVFEFRYDDAGRLAGLRKCNGQTPRWCYFDAALSYDAAGRVVQLDRTDHDATAPNWVTKWVYDGRGLLVRAEEAFPQGHRITDLEYDAAGLPTLVRVRTHAPQTEDRYEVRIEHSGAACEYVP